MTFMKRIARLAAGFGLAMLAASAGAAEFWTYVPGNGNLKVNNPSGGAGFAAVSVTGYNGSGGQFNGFFWTGGAMPADAFFRFFCVDLAQTANGGPNTYLSGTLNDDEIRKLYDIAYPNKTAGDFWDNGAQTSFGVFGDATSAAAFQVALWNLYFDTDLSLSGGAFKWTGAAGAPVATAAQALLDQVGSYGGNDYQRWTLYTFDSERHQNYISATYRVPEPGTLALLLLMLGAFALASRRRLRTSVRR